MKRIWPGRLPHWFVRVMAALGGCLALVVSAVAFGPSPLGPGREQDTNALLLGIGLGGAVVGGVLGYLILRLSGRH